MPTPPLRVLSALLLCGGLSIGLSSRAAASEPLDEFRYGASPILARARLGDTVRLRIQPPLINEGGGSFIDVHAAPAPLLDDVSFVDDPVCLLPTMGPEAELPCPSFTIQLPRAQEAEVRRALNRGTLFDVVGWATEELVYDPSGAIASGTVDVQEVGFPDGRGQLVFNDVTIPHPSDPTLPSLAISGTLVMGGIGIHPEIRYRDGVPTLRMEVGLTAHQTLSARVLEDVVFPVRAEQGLGAGNLRPAWLEAARVAAVLSGEDPDDIPDVTLSLTVGAQGAFRAGDRWGAQLDLPPGSGFVAEDLSTPSLPDDGGARGGVIDLELIIEIDWPSLDPGLFRPRRVELTRTHELTLTEEGGLWSMDAGVESFASLDFIGPPGRLTWADRADRSEVGHGVLADRTAEPHRWSFSYDLPLAPAPLSLTALPDGGLVFGAADTTWGRGYLVSLDAEGAPRWAISTADGIVAFRPQEVIGLDDGGVVVVGSHRGRLWLARFDADGGLLWSRLAHEGADSMEIQFVEADPDDGSIWFGGEAIFAGDIDALLGRVDSEGNLLGLWRSHHPGPDRLRGGTPVAGGFLAVGDAELPLPSALDGTQSIALRVDEHLTPVWSEAYACGRSDSFADIILLSDHTALAIGTNGRDALWPVFPMRMVEIDPATGRKDEDYTYATAPGADEARPDADPDTPGAWLFDAGVQLVRTEDGFLALAEADFGSEGSTWILKLGADGRLRWWRQLDQPMDDRPLHIAPVGPGGVVLTNARGLGELARAWVTHLPGDGDLELEHQVDPTRPAGAVAVPWQVIQQTEDWFGTLEMPFEEVPFSWSPADPGWIFDEVPPDVAPVAITPEQHTP